MENLKPYSLQKVLAPLERKDNKKYCLFHKDHGHETEYCDALKREIKEAIKKKF